MTPPFDFKYGTEDYRKWSLGIVASALLHARREDYGADASYITNKLIENISSLLSRQKEQIVKRIMGLPSSDDSFVFEGKRIEAHSISLEAVLAILKTLGEEIKK